MIRAVIFDCFGVLTTDLWREFVATLPPELASKASELNRAYGAGFLSADEFQQAVRDLTGQQAKEPELLNISDVNKNSKLLEYIAELSETYKIGLLSNVASHWIDEQFLTQQEVSLFDSMIFSFELGITKPDHRIFQIAADRLGVSVEECVMVDDVERNCISAQEVGMQAICYQNMPQFKADLREILAA